MAQRSSLVRAVAHQRENGRLRHDEVAIALEGDFDTRLTEEQRVVADARLHRHESRFTACRAPRLVAQLPGIGHRKAGTGSRDTSALHGLIVHGGRRKVEAHLAPLLTLLERNEDAVAHDDQ